MNTAYNWLKTFHLFFVIAWMVGIFYLPRIMVHYQLAKKEGEGVTRLVIMAMKLYKFSWIMMLFATAIGLTMWLYFDVVAGSWIHAKLVIVLYLVGHQHVCGRFIKQMQKDELKKSSVFFRWFNEIPTLMMLAIIALAILKPF